MHRFSRMHLSPDVARRMLDTIDLEEKSKIAEGISLIAVIDHRRDYLEAGYSCMRDYCMGRLHMSKDKAYRRIQVAKAALRCPELFEYLADGRLSVTTAAVLAPHVEPETSAGLLAAAAFRTQHDIVQMMAGRSRALAAAQLNSTRESLVESSSTSLAVPQVNSLTDLCTPAGCVAVATPLAVPQVEDSRRGWVRAGAAGGHEVRLSITDAEYEDLRAAQALLGHAVPSGDPAVIYARAIKLLRAHLDKQRLGVKPSAAVPAGTGRGIPKRLQRLVWERDGARCTFVGTDGHRCEELGRLEIDHIQPVAMGGTVTPENLRVLCRAHNQYEAERVLGKERVQHRRELAHRERAKAKVAAEAGRQRQATREQAAAEAATARAKPRDAAHQARYDDIHAALRSLGFTNEEARHGAAMADAMPDALLEACLKHVLPILTRPVALRGERRARSTA